MSRFGDRSYLAFQLKKTSNNCFQHIKLTLSAILSTIIKQIADHLRIDPASLQIRPIRHGRFERNNVWRLNTPKNAYILKQHLVAQPVGKSVFSPFQIETAVLPILHRAGCSVPQIIWTSEADSILLLEWCGEKTLDDLAQESPADSFQANHAQCRPGILPPGDGVC